MLRSEISCETNIDERIAQSADEPVSVWRRFMVLGPGTEFVILGPAPLALQLPDAGRRMQ